MCCLSGAITRWPTSSALDVITLHRKIGDKHPYEANRVLKLISKMSALARCRGFVNETAVNPAREIDHYRAHNRDRWVTPEELPRLMLAIGEDPNYYARAALWLYLLTGMRKSEVLKARRISTGTAGLAPAGDKGGPGALCALERARNAAAGVSMATPISCLGRPKENIWSYRQALAAGAQSGGDRGRTSGCSAR
jgi:hypothetical protein